MEYDRSSLNPFRFSEKFLLLVCQLFRAHEMCSQLEVTEMFDCKVNLTVWLLVSEKHLAALKLWSVCVEIGLESLLVTVGQFNPGGYWYLVSLIIMPRKEARS